MGAADPCQGSEHQYHALANEVFDHLAVGIIIVDADLRIVRVNKAFEDFFGIRGDEVVGQSQRRLIEGRLKDILADPARFTEKVLATYDRKTSIEPFACHVLPGDNRQERWLELWSRPIRHGDYAGGRIEHYIDITQRKQYEQSRRTTEKRVRTMAETLGAALFIFQGTQMHYVNATAAAISGYTRDELLRMSFWQMIHPEYQDLVRHRGLARQRGEQVPTRYELKLVTKKGEERWVDFAGCVVTLQGKPAVLGVAFDITERKRLEEQLRQLHKMEAIGTLAGGIAHEFNNILGIILGYAELSQYEIPQGSKVWQNLQAVITAGNRAKELVQQILAFSHPGKTARSPVQLDPFLKETMKLLCVSLPSTIDIKYNLESATGCVNADPTQIQQVLMNLCTNAEYAMREKGGGTLEVRADTVDIGEAFASRHPPLQPGSHIRITVRDTGCGMPPAILEHMFEPFFTTKSSGEGTGMGLAIVHSIVAAHAGTIMVESVPDKGTSFTIYLPLAIEPPEMEAPLKESLPSGEGRILFVDDEEALLRWAQIMLPRLGYEVVVRNNGIEALEVFRSTPHHFDLVITDQTMPHMTGEALVGEIRRIRPEMPVILCTGFSHMMHADKARALGIDAFCMKPLTANDLKRTIRRVLAHY